MHTPQSKEPSETLETFLEARLVNHCNFSLTCFSSTSAARIEPPSFHFVCVHGSLNPSMVPSRALRARLSDGSMQPLVSGPSCLRRARQHSTTRPKASWETNNETPKTSLRGGRAQVMCSRDVHTATSSLWLGVLRRRHGRRLFCLFGVLTSLDPGSDGERLRRRVAPNRRAHEGA